MKDAANYWMAVDMATWTCLRLCITTIIEKPQSTLIVQQLLTLLLSGNPLQSRKQNRLSPKQRLLKSVGHKLPQLHQLGAKMIELRDSKLSWKNKNEKRDNRLNYWDTKRMLLIVSREGLKDYKETRTIQNFRSTLGQTMLNRDSKPIRNLFSVWTCPTHRLYS